MGGPRPVVALAAIGNLGKFLCEELLADGRFDFVVLTRQVSILTVFRAKGLFLYLKTQDRLIDREPYVVEQ